MSESHAQQTNYGITLDLHHRHSWELTPREAVALQRNLAGYVQLLPLGQQPATIAGVDVSVRGGMAQAAVEVVDRQTLQPVASTIWREPVRFPYVSGLLSFREIPTLLMALAQLPFMPDMIMCDGQGIAHPRRIGLASHLGVLLDIPTVGAAKSRLFGDAEEPAPEAGAWTPLVNRKAKPPEVVGALVRTRTHVKPMYVSPGHKITLEEAVQIVLATCTRYRMPEPTRLAHLLSRTTKASEERSQER